MRVIKVLLFALGFYSINALADQTNHLVIYESNCFTQAVIYSLDSDNKPQVVTSATADSIVDESLLGNSGNLRDTDEAASLVAHCLTKLSENYASTAESKESVNIESVVVGMEGYSKCKNDSYNNTTTTKLEHFKNCLCEALTANSFICNKEAINVVRNIDLINNASCQLIKQNVITPKEHDTNNPNNVYTFVLSSMLVAIKSDNSLLNKDAEIYVNNNAGGYFNLGQKTSELFINNEDNKYLNDNQVQQLINESELSKQLADKKNYNLSYWLKDQERKSVKNNARGLAIVKYIVDNTNATTNIKQQELQDTSIAIAQEQSLDLVKQSVRLIEFLSSTNDTKLKLEENNTILITGEMFRSKFIKDNYIKIIEDIISNTKIKEKIQLIDQDNFIYGLAFAAIYFSSDSAPDYNTLLEQQNKSVKKCHILNI